MANANFEPMPFRRQFGGEGTGQPLKNGGAAERRTLADIDTGSSQPPNYDPEAFVDASGAAIVRQVVTGACRKCGYPGHMTYQCRNFIQLKPEVNTTVYDLSSTSSEDSEGETPLVKTHKPKNKSDKKKKKSKSHKKEKKKKEKKSKKRRKRSESDDSDEEAKRKKRKRKRRDSTASSDSDSEPKKKKKKKSSKEKKRRRSNSSSSSD